MILQRVFYIVVILIGRDVMEFKKTLFRLIKTIILVIAALVIIFFAGRYGWKIFGFAACENTAIESVSVSETTVSISGRDPALFPAGFIGYLAKQEGDRLYIGVNYSRLFGFFELGRFDIDIPINGEINEIYLKTAKNSELIWKR